MALKFLNKIFKKDKGDKGPAEQAGGEKQAPEESPRVSVSEKIIPGVLIAPHITEKTSRAADGGKYAFIVSERADKAGVKMAVRSRYGVEVREVNIINIPGKERRRGRQIGWKPGYKKATVTLEKGQSIDIQ